MHNTELEIHKKHTRDFISADPETLAVVNPAQKLSDGAGGYTVVKAEPVDVWCRLIPQTDKVPMTEGGTGDRSRIEYILLAMPDAPVQRYATFDWRGKTYSVEAVHEKPDYEFKADVIIHEG